MTEEGNKYVLAAVDHFTRWVEAFSNQESRSYNCCYRKLVDELFCRFSPPEQLHSDQGRQFESELIEEICKLWRSESHVRHLITHKEMAWSKVTLLDMLATTAHNHPSDCDLYIRKFCLAYNSSIHSSTGIFSYVWAGSEIADRFNVTLNRLHFPSMGRS